MEHVDGIAGARRGSTHSLAATIDAAARFLPAELISRSARRHVQHLAAHLPAALTHAFYLECRLDAADSRTDLIISIEEAGREILGGVNPVQKIRHRHRPMWQMLEGFCDRWPANRQLATVKRLWLEFDVERNISRSLSTPGVFINFRHDADDAETLTPDSAIQALHAVAPASKNRPYAALARCLAAVPSPASVPYLGVFGGRSQDTTRVCIQGLTLDALDRYLANIRWPGDRTAVMRSLADITACRADSAAPAPALVHLDVGRGPLPTVGFEFAFERAPQFRGQLAEQKFLDYLVESRLATPAKRAALTRIAGCSLVTLPHELWCSVMVRQVNHIKIVFDHSGRASAKAYLLFSFLPHPDTHALPI